jgi:hypothetical protein
MGAADAAVAAAPATSDNLRTLTDYIPSEVLTLYIAGIAAVGSWSFLVSGSFVNAALKTAAIQALREQYFEWLFWGCLAATPVWIFFGVFLASKSTPNWRAFLWPMLAAPIAFYIYALAIPNSWLAARNPNGGLFATLLLLIITPLLHGITLIYAKLFPPPVAP